MLKWERRVLSCGPLCSFTCTAGQRRDGVEAGVDVARWPPSRDSLKPDGNRPTQGVPCDLYRVVVGVVGLLGLLRLEGGGWSVTDPFVEHAL